MLIFQLSILTSTCFHYNTLIAFNQNSTQYIAVSRQYKVENVEKPSKIQAALTTRPQEHYRRPEI